MVKLRDQVKDLSIEAKRRRRVDFDPEDETFTKQDRFDESADSESSSNHDLGKEHYEKVGKSKLRQPEQTRLDKKKYGGQVVSRENFFQVHDPADILRILSDEDDDPFSVKRASPRSDDSEEEEEDTDNSSASVPLSPVPGHDEEIDSDEAFVDGEEERFRSRGFIFRGSGKDLKSLPIASDEDEDDDDDEDEGDEISDASDVSRSDVEMNDSASEDREGGSSPKMSGASEISGEDEDEDEESERDESSTTYPRSSITQVRGTTDREKLKALASNDTAAIASSLSAALSADIKKGSAVKRQYQTFDRLLDARIKLQKALVASSSVHNTVETTNQEAQKALQTAEEAALKLYATIESLRHTIREAQPNSNQNGQLSGKKRKRPLETPTVNTSTTVLWSRMAQIESESLPTRRQVLDKWSAKTRTASSLPASSRLHSNNGNSASSSSKISEDLDAYLVSKQSQLIVPATAIEGVIPYDDTNFYQSLLRDLISSHALLSSSSSSSFSAANNGTTTGLSLLPSKLHASGNTARATKIDTKASKGRKVQYTVHAKLENFMASEGRRYHGNDYSGNGSGRTAGGGEGGLQNQQQWSDAAIREFFGSLLGQRNVLAENEDDDDDDEDEVDREAQALRLFG